jgi:predicted PurR-regulated permease PerM
VTGAVRRRVQVTPSSAVRVAAVAVGALAVLIAMDRSRPVLNWVVTAAAAALLLDGAVRGLARWMHRGVAVAAVTVATLTGAALLTYGVVDAVVEQYDGLRSSAPAAAASLETSERVGGLAQRVRLAERTDALVEQAPERLFGSPADAAQTAAVRLGEIVLVITLTIFMLVTYERFEQRVQSLDVASRQELGRWAGLDAGVTAGARSARQAVARVVLLGVVTGLVAQAVGAPAPMALGLWMAWWRLLPLFGLVVGYAPLVLVLLADDAVVAAVALVVLAALEVAVRWGLGAAGSPRGLGIPMGVVTVVAFAAGAEMAGVVGAVVGVVLAHVAVGALRGTAERAPADVRTEQRSGSGAAHPPGSAVIKVRRGAPPGAASAP